MKICFSVSTFLSRSQTFVTTQVLYAVRAGHEVSVACKEVAGDAAFSAEDQALIDQVRVIHWPPAPPPFLRHLPTGLADRVIARRNARSWKREVDADVVVAHFGYQGARIARAQSGWAARPPLITIYHGRDVSVEYKRNGMAKYRQLFAEGDLHLPVNRCFGELLVKAGAPADRVETLHLGVPVERYRFAPKPIGTPLRLVSVCRLVEKKGLDVAIEALAMLRARRPEVEWRYEIGGDGPMGAALRAQVAERGLGDRVRFLGALSHEATLERIAAADVLLAPSVTAKDGDQEGIPVTLMEAMALGTVVCATRHSGIPELLEDGASGVLSKEGDAIGLFKNIAAVSHGKNLASNLVDAARLTIELHFDSWLQTKALLRQCDGLIGSKMYQRKCERSVVRRVLRPKLY
ncbi:MAG: glycosyltransferase [Pseudomonadota bacterium]